MVTKARFRSGAHEHVAQFVREQIRKGRWIAGQAIDVTALADELAISPSPVREALARLRGEGVLGFRHRDGYSLPLLQTHELAGEYRLMGMLAQSIATQTQAFIDARKEPATTYADRIEALLGGLAHGADLPAAALKFQQSILRLHSYVAAEPQILPDNEQTLADMERAFADRDQAQLAALMAHHFKSCEAASAAIGRFVYERAAARDDSQE